jgi:hypothetical protein
VVDVKDTVARAWQRNLEFGAVEADDDFFALGGTSLLAARIIAELNEELGLSVGLRTLVDNPTRRALADALCAELARQVAQAGT